MQDTAILTSISKISSLEIIFIYTVIFLLNLELCMCVCNQAEYEINGQCCPMCSPGNHVYQHCTDDTSTTCIPCLSSTYIVDPNGREKCFICSTCDPGNGLRIKTQCTRLSNTVCEPQERHYCIDQVRGSCTQAEKHTTCSPGHYIQQEGTALKDTVCDVCTAGTYSDGSLQTCQPHSQCEDFGLVEIKPGTSSSDAECGTQISVAVIAGIISGVVVVVVAAVGVGVFLKKKHKMQYYQTPVTWLNGSAQQRGAGLCARDNVDSRAESGTDGRSERSERVFVESDRLHNMLPGKTGTPSDFVRLLHVLGVYAALAYGHKCGQSEYESASGECCPMCNIGSVVLRDCKGDSSTTCIPCSPATYMNKPNGLQKCFPCKICDHGQGLSVSKVCTTIENTVCGVLDGFYCRDYTVDECTFALKHKKCQPGQEGKVQGTTISDTVCEACPHGFYSPLGVNCTKWTDCSSRNEDVSEKGSSVQDVTCKPRRDRNGLIAVFIVAAFLGLLVLCFFVFQKTKFQHHTEKRREAKLKTPVEETNTSLNAPEENKEGEGAPDT
ncbi:uncharacterized protein LOC143511705 [Brachyhypopomus gauderio]|uniref:uncharacterized protein LOC143511705 n=1 Tax=Brachyhypopomus gauderio TaxID=698409 RepID=UPI004042034E